MPILQLMLAPLLLAASPASDTRPEYDGWCQYSEAVRERADAATVLIDCSSFALDQSGASAGFEFGQRGWEKHTRFEGQLLGERMQVTSVVLRNGSRLEARGDCEIFRANGNISVVSCMAEAKAVWYVANFKVSPVSN